MVIIGNLRENLDWPRLLAFPRLAFPREGATGCGSDDFEMENGNYQPWSRNELIAGSLLL
jgi:hypothetical protein